MSTDRHPNPAPTAVVSGGSRGLGEALVADRLAAGWRVATFSRTPTAFTEACAERFPDRFLWAPVDAADGDRVTGFVTAVLDRFDRIDALVNNAAIAADGLLALASDDDLDRVLAVNLRAALVLTRGCGRAMLAQGDGGSIVNVSSVNAVRGHAGVAAYSATKAALDGLTRSLARELGERGVRVNSVAPGYFESDLSATLTAAQRDRIARRTPLGRLATPADVVAVVRFLLSPDAAFVTGQTIVVDGGMTC